MRVIAEEKLEQVQEVTHNRGHLRLDVFEVQSLKYLQITLSYDGARRLTGCWIRYYCHTDMLEDVCE